MQAFLVTILLLLSVTLSTAEELRGVGQCSERSVQTSTVTTLGVVCDRLVCSPDGIHLTLSVEKLRNMKVDYRRIHLQDRSCSNFAYDNDYVYITWSLGKDVCGGNRIVTGTHAVYRNYVYLPPDPTEIIYREAYVYNVSCTYPLDMIVHNDPTLIPNISITYINIDNSGEFAVKMLVYNDIRYTTVRTDSPIVLSTRFNLYIGIKISEGDTSFRVRMINCFSTPTNNVFDSVKYNIISNSCPNPSDSTIHIVENGISNEGKFYIQMFKFIGDYERVYLHCAVKLCENSCSPSCSSRSVSPDPDGILTIGPFQRAVDDEPETVTDGVKTVTDGVKKVTGGVGTAAFSMVTLLGLLLMNIFIV